MMTPGEIDKLQKECEYEALKEKVERLSENTNKNTNKNTITISMEEYKELLMIKGRYEELKEQPAKPILYREPTIIKEHGNIPFRETLTTDPLPKSPYKITCNNEEEQL